MKQTTACFPKGVLDLLSNYQSVISASFICFSIAPLAINCTALLSESLSARIGRMATSERQVHCVTNRSSVPTSDNSRIFSKLPTSYCSEPQLKKEIFFRCKNISLSGRCRRCSSRRLLTSNPPPPVPTFICSSYTFTVSH